MSNLSKSKKPVGDASDYDLMVELEQMESLHEDMEEMGVSTLEEVDRRIADLHHRLDKREEK